MRFFVTGATGFIGRHLVRRLVADGHQVAALVRDPARVAVLPPGVTLLKGDLGLFRTDVALPESDVVVHLAGAVVAPDDAAYRAINHDATLDLVRCVERQPWSPRRLLYASSMAATGPTTVDRPKSEDDEDLPVEAYGRAKKDAEVWLANNAPFPVTSFRPPMVLGPEDPATFTLFQMARYGLGFRASHDQVVSWVDVDDLVDALLLFSAAEDADNHLYFTPHPDPIRTSELWTALGRAFSRRVLVLPLPVAGLRAAGAFTRLGSAITGWNNQLDGKMIEQLAAPAFTCRADRLLALGWRPRHDLDATIARTARAWEAAGRL